MCSCWHVDGVCCCSPPQAFAANMARQHYLLVIKRKAFHAMRRMIENKWRSRVERACKNKAQDVCMDLNIHLFHFLNKDSSITVVAFHR